MIRAIGAGCAHQLRMMRGTPDWFLALFTTPLLTAVFLTIFQASARQDLTTYAVLAPALMALWTMSLQTAGELISQERENGSLEALLAAPAPFAAVLFGRIGAVTLVSLVAFVEAWLVGWLLTGAPLPVPHPVLFVLTVAATTWSMTGWAGVMACVFVLARSARTFQNSLSYPFFVLGGVLVPVTLLPDWLSWPARAVFLSWSADLLRDSLDAAPVVMAGGRLLIVAALGAAGYVLSHALLTRTLRRVRTTGRLAHA